MASKPRCLALGVMLIALGLPPAAIAGELTAIADFVQQMEEQSKVPGPLAKSFGMSDDTIMSKSNSIGTVKPLDLRGFQVVPTGNTRRIVISNYQGQEATWYLSDDDGELLAVRHKKIGGELKEVALSVAKEAFKKEKIYWLERHKKGLVKNQAPSS